MSTVSDPANAGQIADPSITTPTAEERIVALLADLLRRTRSIASRLDTLEHRFDYLDRDILEVIGANARRANEANEADEEGADVEPLTEPNPAPFPPPLALRSDGKVLLSTRDLEGVDVATRETFTGIVLSEAEVSDILDRVSEAFDDAAAHSAGWLTHKGKKRGGGA